MFKFIITGVVQGVGFRPYIYNACLRANLVGYVQNIGIGVEIVVDNKEKMELILKSIPTLARIDNIEITKIKQTNQIFSKFTIKPSKGKGYAEIPPDLDLCPDCVKELQQSKNLRYNYFFITCTNCGPRFSIIKSTPYDRSTTSMNSFKMCKTCLKEYKDPTNRRYHAQTTACPECGPTLELFIKKNKIKSKNKSNLLHQLEIIKKTADILKQGKIVAIKSNGGYHLASICQKNVIQKLRKLTNRKNKPYAIMCKDLRMAQTLVKINAQESQVLTSTIKPIVILKKKKSIENNQNWNEVSELNSLGIMLPYSGLHYLLFDHLFQPIILTSSNLSNQPITTKSNEQFVNHILSHNRQIINPIDDSIVKILPTKKQHITIIRKSRGYTPKSFQVPTFLNSKKTILALGAEENATFSIFKKGKIYTSQYMGNCKYQNIIKHYNNELSKWLKMLDAKPDIILSDQHPDFETSKLAKKLEIKYQAKNFNIQHHLAHAFSVMIEHQLNDHLAIVCDGIGYNDNSNSTITNKLTKNKLWGGEVFHISKNGKSVQRIASLEPQLLLGGDTAAKNPANLIFSILQKINLNKIKNETIINHLFNDKKQLILKGQYHTKINSFYTTSTGRIIDAASVLLDFCNKTTYHARPALLLETKASKPYQLQPIITNDQLLTTPLFKYLTNNLHKDKSRLAATVLNYLAHGFFHLVSGYNLPFSFSGGVAYNNQMSKILTNKGGLLNKEVPCGDGGISFGQISYYLYQQNI